MRGNIPTTGSDKLTMDFVLLRSVPSQNDLCVRGIARVLFGEECKKLYIHGISSYIPSMDDLQNFFVRYHLFQYTYG